MTTEPSCVQNMNIYNVQFTISQIPKESNTAGILGMCNKFDRVWCYCNRSLLDTVKARTYSNTSVVHLCILHHLISAMNLH